MDADGSDAHRFVSEPGASWDGEAAVSPDGRWVAFNHVFDARPKQRVSLVSADGTGPVTQVGPELDSIATWVWSPDSTRLLVVPDEGARHSQYLVDPSDGTFTIAPWQSASGPDWQRTAP
jgi:Tol biopolymer transport system component